MPVTRSQSGAVRRSVVPADLQPAEMEKQPEDIQVPQQQEANKSPVLVEPKEKEQQEEEPVKKSFKKSVSSKKSTRSVRIGKVWQKIAHAKYEMYLADLRAIEAEGSEEEDGDSLDTNSVGTRRVEDWLEVTKGIPPEEPMNYSEALFEPTVQEATAVNVATPKFSRPYNAPRDADINPPAYSAPGKPDCAAIQKSYQPPATTRYAYTNTPMHSAAAKPDSAAVRQNYQPPAASRDTYSKPPIESAAVPQYPHLTAAPLAVNLDRLVHGAPIKAEERTEQKYNPWKKPEQQQYQEKLAPPPEPMPQKQTGDTINLSELASAIALAARSGQQPTTVPRYIGELPYFNGSHHEWLAFRAAYTETASYFIDIENTARLRRALKGKAREAVNCLLIANGKPEKILGVLETRFGRSDAIAHSELNQLRNLQRTTDDPRDICLFASKVQNSIATLQVLQRDHNLNNTEVLKALVDKLTPSLRYRWFDYATENEDAEPELIKFNRFLEREASRCSKFASPEVIREDSGNRSRPKIFRAYDEHRYRPERTFKANEENRDRTDRPLKKNDENRNRPQTVRDNRGEQHGAFKTQGNDPRDRRYCKICEKSGHWGLYCDKFKNADSDGRWELAKQYRLCFRCLYYKSAAHKCDKRRCGVDSCQRTHHPLLHYEKVDKYEEEKTASERVTSTVSTEQFTFLKILPVRISGPNGCIDTHALLDDGSTITLIDADIAKQIGVHGPAESLKIEAIAGTKINTGISQRVSIKIQGQGAEYDMKARTMNRLQLAPQAVSEEDIRNCKHLWDLKDKLKYREGKPTILIGQDNWQLLIANQIRRGSNDQPVASRTPLGWVLHGASTRSLGRQVHYVHRATEDKLDEEIKKYFSLESLGILPRTTQSDPDERALSISQQKTVERQEGGYETALLWKEDTVNLPNNYDQALKRLLSTEKNLDRDPDLKASYEKQIEDLLSKGYAEIAPTSPTPGKTWYLPHFAVLHSAKPGKVRVVFDAAARAGGTSLNDHLLSGPDLLQSLPGVLMRFRQHPIAVAADIEEMFLRIGIVEKDRDVLRFLWRQDRREGPPTEYRMKSMIFGAASSPCTALFVKNFNAEKWRDQYPDAAEAIIAHHYMDDYLQSFQTEEEAIKTATEVRLVHSKGNFNLRKWTSNREKIVQDLEGAPKSVDSEIKLNDGHKEEKVLGLTWKPKTDTLGFNLNFARVPAEIINGTRTPTKREALRTVMSLFDPLGLVSPITIQAKQILQETWRNGTGWDEEIPKELANKWKAWVSELRKLQDVNIPRCHAHLSTAIEREIHTFVDASETAYAAAVYWRVVDPLGKVHVTLAAGKARVAPLKLTSIPRLELQAAILGCRLAKIVTEEYQLKPDKRFYWTDSKTVLAWLRAGPRTFKPFVAHRVAAIEEETTVKEWRWIPTRHNVADDATRSVPSEFGSSHRWFIGPEFLLQNAEQWPVEKENIVTENTGEERVHIVQKISKLKLTEALPDVTRFSSWLRLIRTTARVLQFIDLLKRTNASVNIYKRNIRNKEADPMWKKEQSRSAKPMKTQREQKEEMHVRLLDADFVRHAEDLWVQASQQESFPADIAALKNNKSVASDSRLRQLAITMDDGKIKLKSRITAAQDVPIELKQPAVLDGDHRYTQLYIAWLHRKLQHGGTEMIVNEARQHFWILRLRPVTKTVIKRCLECRIRRAKPAEPPTGNHPQNRLAHHQRPFTYTGLDYFGPLSVTVGRSHLKRYVALFTCLTTRAVHLELVYNLSADSAILALRRMIARRGCPTEIYSDNGTNLHGANRELQEAIRNEASKRAITWKFIPPSAPFMGGAWERLVRSVKTALCSVLHERHPLEETLVTLLCEAEYTVNSRPLTHVSTSPEDDEALTPNHFLLGGSGGVQHLGVFTDTDLKLRSLWRRTQRLADMFWERWLKEYLPELQYRREPHGHGNPLRIGDLVLIVDPTLPRNTWPRGKVIETFPGQD